MQYESGHCEICKGNSPVDASTSSILKGDLAMAASIFEKQASLKPSAMKTVAERRFDDAEALRKTNDNARANGVAYLVGFVIEILLKARLVAKFSRIAKTPQHLLKENEREIWTIQARYSSRMMLMDEAARLLERVRVLKELLK